MGRHRVAAVVISTVLLTSGIAILVTLELRPSNSGLGASQGAPLLAVGTPTLIHGPMAGFGCENADVCYVSLVESSSDYVTPPNLSFVLTTSNGSIVRLPNASVGLIAGNSSLGAFNLSAGMWSPATVDRVVVSGSTLLLDTGATALPNVGAIEWQIILTAGNATIRTNLPLSTN